MPDKYTVECYPSWICSECSTQLTNDESPVDMSEEDEQAWWERYIAGTGDCLITPGTGPEHHECGQYGSSRCECDHEDWKDFACSICYRHVIGEAFRVTFWKEPEEEAQTQTQHTKSDIMTQCMLCHQFFPVSDMNVNQECIECEDAAIGATGF